MIRINSFQKKEIDFYKENHKSSYGMWVRAIENFPGGVNHNIRTLDLPLIGLYPPFVKKSIDITLEDVDGNKYTDFWLGHYSQILGHNNPIIRNKVQERLEQGWMAGTVIEEQVRLAEKITSISKNIDKVRFQTSGSESVMNAIRLAKKYTKRDIIAKVDIGYHGANALTVNGYSKLEELDDSDSIIPQKVISFHLDQSTIERLFKEFGKILACVLIEPILGGTGGATQVDIELLKLLREQCDQYGVVLIFDEIVSGYRFQHGLYQDKIGLYADLTTLGKIIGGGFPIGGLGGIEEIMELANPSTKRKEKVIIGGGTFSSHAITMTAGIATLELLETKKDDYNSLNKLGDYFRSEINKISEETKQKYITTNFGSLLLISAFNTNPWEGEKINRLEIIKNIDKKEQALLQLYLLNRNVYGYHGLGSLSFLHTKKDAEEVIKKLTEVMMQNA